MSNFLVSQLAHIRLFMSVFSLKKKRKERKDTLTILKRIKHYVQNPSQSYCFNILKHYQHFRKRQKPKPKKQTNKQTNKKKTQHTSYKSRRLLCVPLEYSCALPCMSSLHNNQLFLIVLLFLHHSLIKPNTLLLFIRFNSIAKCSATQLGALECSV